MKIETEEQHVLSLLALLAEANEVNNLAGASCIYNAGGKTHCANLTSSQCSTLGGIYNSSTTCSMTPSGTTQCQAS